MLVGDALLGHAPLVRLLGHSLLGGLLLSGLLLGGALGGGTLLGGLLGCERVLGLAGGGGVGGLLALGGCGAFVVEAVGEDGLCGGVLALGGETFVFEPVGQRGGGQVLLAGAGELAFFCRARGGEAVGLRFGQHVAGLLGDRLACHVELLLAQQFGLRQRGRAVGDGVAQRLVGQLQLRGRSFGFQRGRR
ncbi:hypothetical protein [Pseudoduganella sp. UC29_71]|uniref:hypothetical protein n=1 Tax=Pseudoduganella sp. UC29_71 TaxID=3350174 RepID=UPI003672989F